MKRRYLSTAEKIRWKPHYLEKQDNDCIFCKEEFTNIPANKEMSITYEHLDKDVFNNEEWNLALAHKKCNDDKKWNPDYQIIAKELLEQNKRTLDSLSVCKQRPDEPKPTSKEIDINVATFNLADAYLIERLKVQNKPALDFNDTMYSIFYLLKETTGHGSSETVKRTLLGFTSTAGPYDKVKDQNGNWVIIKKVKKSDMEQQTWQKENESQKTSVTTY